MASASRAWLDINEEGRRLVERLGGRWGSNGGMCRCPAHDDRTPSLSVRVGRTRLLLHCFAGCEASAILRALALADLLDANAGGGDEAVSGGSDGTRRDAARRLWSEAQELAATPAAAYLQSRGLRSSSPELRYHPRTPCGPGPLTRFRPALIAAVRDDTGLAAVHRTFIAPGGRGLAALDAPRRGLGRYGAGAVRLGGIGPRLGLAEGIETALSASALFGIPCWAALGTDRFARVALPGEVRELILYLDHDSGGRRAERLARKAFADVERIDIQVPERAGEDWNDVLRRRAGEMMG